MLYGTRIRGLRAAVVFACLSFAVAGCHRKPVVPPLPQITQPVDLETPPPPENPPMVEAPPVKLPPVPTASAASKIKRERRKKAAQPTTTAVVAPAPAPASETTPATAEVAAIGALSSGGDASPRVQQEAAGLIAANDKRLNGLSTQKVEQERAQISKVRNFQRQAQEALNSGDTEGAKTLATKAKLLLDDIEK